MSHGIIRAHNIKNTLWFTSQTPAEYVNIVVNNHCHHRVYMQPIYVNIIWLLNEGYMNSCAHEIPCTT